MNLVRYNRYNPAHDLESIFGSDKFFGRVWDDFFPVPRVETLVPSVNITENDNEFTLIAEVPGMKEQDIELDVHDGVLTLRGKKEATAEKEDETDRVREFTQNSFERSFRLGGDVDPEKVTARLEGGMLRVSIPKKEEVKAKKIEIKVNG